jgi:hypothetical protein
LLIYKIGGFNWVALSAYVLAYYEHYWLISSLLSFGNLVAEWGSSAKTAEYFLDLSQRWTQWRR